MRIPRLTPSQAFEIEYGIVTWHQLDAAKARRMARLMTSPIIPRERLEQLGCRVPISFGRACDESEVA